MLKTETRKKTMITEKPANGFNTRVLIKCEDTLFTRPAWARFTDASDYVDTIQIRKDGDFGGLIRRVHRSRVIIPA
jgi:hypothetical protein